LGLGLGLGLGLAEGEALTWRTAQPPSAAGGSHACGARVRARIRG